MFLNRMLESHRAPHWLVRRAVRTTFLRGLRRQYKKGVERQNTQKRALMRKFNRSPIAHHTEDANLQHYEVPSAFFEYVLGSRMKYSCCYWPQSVQTLDEAEEASLRQICERARIKDGIRILDLGCGWGALTLWIAEHFPACEVLAVSNSKTQAEYIMKRAQNCGYQNVRTMTANVALLEIDERFDRVISIEMFEHMKNYGALLEKIAGWLEREGMVFVHHFSHKRFAYEFDASNPDDWMARTFFSGGTMPSDDLLLYYQEHLRIVSHWTLSGIHYARTLRAWWDRMHHQRENILAMLEQAYGPYTAKQRFHHWRMFFLITEETWKLRRGQEYLVTQLLFQPSSR